LPFNRLVTITIVVCGFFLATTITFANAAPSDAEPQCTTYDIGIDTSHVQGGDSAIGLGEALGETFQASDTLIESITLWRWPVPNPSYAGWHLWIVETDSLGRPHPELVISNGPSIWNLGGDGIHYTPMVFSFSPPLALPHRGEYELAVQSDPCDGAIGLAINVSNAYPFGIYWHHSRTFGEPICHPRGGPDGFGNYDMIFDVQFCSPSVPTRAETWGRVKANYR
jgi:hypothetical protein